MSAADTRSTKILFRDWRQGDAEAGQLMAQRFADWYYAIATSRLGERGGAGPCESACGKFGQGVVAITDSKALVPWAHGVIQEELKTAGNRITDGDEPSNYTSSQSPKTALAKARVALPEDVALLEATYKTGSTASIEPLPILQARYRVKRWLKDNANIAFDVTPDNPILDYAPLPLYESARMATNDEEGQFEQYMISDIQLCKDIAEFAHFAIALRGGLPSAESFAATQAKSAPAPVAARNDGPGAGTVAAAAGGGLLVIGGGIIAVLLIVIVIAYFVFAG